MLKINGKVWYEPLVNPCYVNDISEFAGDATENECVLGAINWIWYHYPTREEALEGLKKRSPEDYKEELKKHWSTGCMESFSTREEALEFLHKVRGNEDYRDVSIRYFGNGFIKKHYPTGCNSYGDKIEPKYTAFFSHASTGWCICEMEEERYGIHHWAYRLHR